MIDFPIWVKTTKCVHRTFSHVLPMATRHGAIKITAQFTGTELGVHIELVGGATLAAWDVQDETKRSFGGNTRVYQDFTNSPVTALPLLPGVCYAISNIK